MGKIYDDDESKNWKNRSSKRRRLDSVVLRISLCRVDYVVLK